MLKRTEKRFFGKKPGRNGTNYQHLNYERSLNDSVKQVNQLLLNSKVVS